MIKIPTNKKDLFEFINKEFPGQWTEFETGYELILKDKDDFIIKNISFFFEGPSIGLLFPKYIWKCGLAFKEAKLYYKTNYNMNNFK